MGETGCGKTKLIEFFASVKRLMVEINHPSDRPITNFVILKVIS